MTWCYFCVRSLCCFNLALGAQAYCPRGPLQGLLREPRGPGSWESSLLGVRWRGRKGLFPSPLSPKGTGVAEGLRETRVQA